ncbi:MAG: DUF3530 family protein [Colwellia sp.]
MNKTNQINFNSVSFSALILLFVFSIHVTWAEQENIDLNPEEPINAEEPIKETSKANTETSTNTVKPPIALIKQHKADLKHYLEGEQVKPLLVGPDEYITLVKKYTSAHSKGVVILLPEWQQGATNPKAIGFLRDALPSYGWNTISIQPLNKPKNFPSTALTLTEQKKENDIVLQEYKRKLSALFNAIMNTAKEYPGIVLVIAQGNNGALLMDIYSQEASQHPNALILLSSYRQSNYGLVDSVNEKFSRQLAVSEIPVLDLYLKYDNTLVLTKAHQRKLMAKQEMKTYYRQRQLNNTITGYYPEKELLKQIKGWLKTIGW